MHVFRPERSALFGGASLIGPLLLLVGCATQTGSPSATAEPTPVLVAEISLPPASEAPPPEEIPDPAGIPSVPPPSGDPEAPEIEVEYDLSADDSDAFADAYRTAFESLDLTDEEINIAGARLCTYLMRHADADGAVALEDAITEADLNQPGFARETWELAFEIATSHYCGEFSL